MQAGADRVFLAVRRGEANDDSGAHRQSSLRARRLPRFRDGEESGGIPRVGSRLSRPQVGRPPANVEAAQRKEAAREANLLPSANLAGRVG